MTNKKEVNMGSATADKLKKIRGNPVTGLPEPPVPSQVRLSHVEEQQPKGEVKVAPKEAPVSIPSGASVSEDVARVQESPGQVVETEPKGVITIRLYHNKPYEADFSGFITGTEMSIAWRAMMKQYKLWKLKLYKAGGK